MSTVNPVSHEEKARYVARHKIRVVTAAALFDGHDAAIGVMRRLLQAGGAEVIHLGHNRGAEEVVDAAIQEDAQAIAVSSYQGGHIEYFKYMVDLLRDKGAGHITVWGGGGGVIVPREIEELHAYGVKRIFSPEDGRRLGLEGMIDVILAGADFSTEPADPLAELAALAEPGALDSPLHKTRLARLVTAVENAAERGGDDPLLAALREPIARRVPVLGITGTGGAGKSSLTDEILSRLLRDHHDRRIAVVSVDPTRKRTGGALLGDRIRMNSLRDPRVMMRSLATRAAGVELSRATGDIIRLLRRVGYDLIIVETSGIGQGDAEVTKIADVSLYVMTAEYGAPSQLEKIEMLDAADFVAVNKFEHRGSKDALRDVRKQVRRNRGIPYSVPDEQLPVFGTVASRFFDRGVSGLYAALCDALSAKGDRPWVCRIPPEQRAVVSDIGDLIPGDRQHYLAEIVRCVRGYKARARRQAEIARQIGALETARALIGDEGGGEALARKADELRAQLDADARRVLDELPKTLAAYREPEFAVKIRNSVVRYPTHFETLSGSRVPRVAGPRDLEPGALVRFGMLENLPGYFPFTGGVFPFKREGEDPKRMFAGEGGPARTNERFHFLSRGEPAKRLSTAFDSVTLYGWDPDERPDVFGKIGESGVSVCTLDDAKLLYRGFDLCDPATSVSMTINGPAPIILAFFMNTAIDQQVEREEARLGRALTPEE
ncbi:MAG TPA: methylmalonyl-CoA mutase family protein, partial [Nannocystis sp.]